MIRQFAVGNLTPDSANEFQRADCAPVSTLGEGVILSNDVIIARNYEAGILPPAPAGGLIGPPSVQQKNSDRSMIDEIYAYFFGPKVGVGEVKTENGTQVIVPIEITPIGDEAAMSFTLEFDANVLSNPHISLGEDAPDDAALTINANNAASGRIGILVDSLSDFKSIGKPRQFITVTFDVSKNAVTGATPITLTGSLAGQSTSDAEGNLLSTYYRDGRITITSSFVK